MASFSWNTIPVYMMDFEGSPGSGVVEFGVVCLRGGAIVDTGTGLCAPVGSIAGRDREVHGISETDVRDKAPFANYYRQFVGYREEGVFAAHNRHAENNFLKGTWAVPALVPDWRNGSGKTNEWGPWIDTLAIYKALYPGLESCALGELVDRFHLREQLEVLSTIHCPPSRRRAHCALYDALASSLLLLRLEGEELLLGHLTLEWLLSFSKGYSGQQELF